MMHFNLPHIITFLISHFHTLSHPLSHACCCFNEEKIKLNYIILVNSIPINNTESPTREEGASLMQIPSLRLTQFFETSKFSKNNMKIRPPSGKMFNFYPG